MTDIKVFYAPSTKGFYHSDVQGQVVPKDAVQITRAEYNAHMAAQSGAPGQVGKVLVWDTGQGGIIHTDPPPPTTAQKISFLEATITPRRMREAVLGLDKGWLININGQIAAMRAQL